MTAPCSRWIHQIRRQCNRCEAPNDRSQQVHLRGVRKHRIPIREDEHLPQRVTDIYRRWAGIEADSCVQANLVQMRVYPQRRQTIRMGQGLQNAPRLGLWTHVYHVVVSYTFLENFNVDYRGRRLMVNAYQAFHLEGMENSSLWRKFQVRTTSPNSGRCTGTTTFIADPSCKTT